LQLRIPNCSEAAEQTGALNCPDSHELPAPRPIKEKFFRNVGLLLAAIRATLHVLYAGQAKYLVS
jgi:hypothetical protein